MPSSSDPLVSDRPRPELPAGMAVPVSKTKSEATYEVLREWIVSGELPSKLGPAYCGQSAPMQSLHIPMASAATDQRHRITDGLRNRAR